MFNLQLKLQRLVQTMAGAAPDPESWLLVINSLQQLHILDLDLGLL
jgi:hypothetical protein